MISYGFIQNNQTVSQPSKKHGHICKHFSGHVAWYNCFNKSLLAMHGTAMQYIWTLWLTPKQLILCHALTYEKCNETNPGWELSEEMFCPMGPESEKSTINCNEVTVSFCIGLLILLSPLVLDNWKFVWTCCLKVPYGDFSECPLSLMAGWSQCFSPQPLKKGF